VLFSSGNGDSAGRSCSISAPCPGSPLRDVAPGPARGALHRRGLDQAPATVRSGEAVGPADPLADRGNKRVAQVRRGGRGAGVHLLGRGAPEVSRAAERDDPMNAKHQVVAKDQVVATAVAEAPLAHGTALGERRDPAGRLLQAVGVPTIPTSAPVDPGVGASPIESGQPAARALRATGGRRARRTYRGSLVRVLSPVGARHG